MPPVKPDFPDHYTDLNIRQTATPAEIKLAHRRLALLHHPDKKGLGNSKDDADFKRIQAAYEILGDAQERARYDMKYAAWDKYWEDLRKERGGFQGDTPDVQSGTGYAPAEQTDGEEYDDASMAQLLARHTSVQARLEQEQWEHQIHVRYGAYNRNGWDRCGCPGCQARLERQEEEAKNHPLPRPLTDREYTLLCAYQAARARNQRRKAEKERRAAAAKQRREAKENTRHARAEAARQRSEDAARRARRANERAARRRMARAYIKGKQDEYLARLKAEGGRVKAEAEGVDECIGWVEQKGDSTCLFCDKDLWYFFQLPDGGAVACRPCKRRLSDDTTPLVVVEHED